MLLGSQPMGMTDGQQILSGLLEIIVDDNPGALPTDERTFYRNADKTRRNGLELGGRWRPAAMPRLQISGALTYMDARFDDATNNTLPGLPDWTASGNAAASDGLL